MKKSKTMAGVLSIAAAVLIGGTFWAVTSANVSAVPVVRAKQEIPYGTKITADMVETVKMGRLNLPKNITGNNALIVGAYADKDLSAHEIISGSDLAKKRPTYALQDGQMLYSISVKNLADSVSGKLRSGDIARAFVCQQTTGNDAVQVQTAETSPAELQALRVMSVTTSAGQEAGTGSTGSSGASTQNQPATVTVIVNQQQADLLSSMSQSEIRLALVSRGNENRAQELLAQQDAELKGAQK